MKNRSIGVFDSGMGGISTLIELKKVMPNENFIYYGDSENAPYGIKTPEEILALSKNVAEKLVQKGIKAMVVACNTATSVAVNELRDLYPELIIIGLEPALKVSVDLGAKNIIVMATQRTLKEDKFNILEQKYASDCNVYKIPCPELVQIAENGKIENEDICFNQIKKYFENINTSEINSVVLGCTHFVFYKKYIEKFFSNNCSIVDGNIGTAKHLKNELIKRNYCNDSTSDGFIEFFNSQKLHNESDINKLELSKILFNKYSNNVTICNTSVV